MTNPTIIIASDHAGYELKQQLKTMLEANFQIMDMGTDSDQSVDYPVYASRLCDKLQHENDAVGILVCGSGIGMSMTANRYNHIRAALCHNSLEARLARQHNNANVLVLGARMIGSDLAKDCVEQFLHTPFEGGRHQRRVDQMTNPASLKEMI